MGSDARKSYKKGNINIHFQLIIIHWEHHHKNIQVVDRKRSMVWDNAVSLRVLILISLDFRQCITTTL